MAARSKLTWAGLLPWLAAAALALGGCAVEVDKEVDQFCPYNGSSCTKVAHFAGPDWNEEPFIFLDSVTGLPDTVLVTGRSSFFDYQKARIPRLFPNSKYTDKYVERFYYRASGFRLEGGEFTFQGDAASNTVTAMWGNYRVSRPIKSAFAYVNDSVPGRPVRDDLQLWRNLDFDATAPRPLTAEFISTIGLYKLHVGPYNGKTYTYIRQNLLY